MAGPGERGIWIGGSAQVSGQVASGDHVSQNQNIVHGGPVRDALAEAERLLEEHADELEAPDRARRDLADVRDEATSDDPDPERMGGALDRLETRVVSVAALAQAVRNLAAAVGLG